MKITDVKKARKLLSTLVPEKRKAISTKGDFLEQVKTEILEAVEKNASVRQITEMLKMSGYAGSYQLLQRKIQEWRENGSAAARKSPVKAISPQRIVEQGSGVFSEKKNAYDNTEI